MSAECGNKWTKEVVDSLSASYEIGEQGVDLNEALELCIPAMEQLCASDCPDDWLLYSYDTFAPCISRKIFPWKRERFADRLSGSMWRY